MIDMGVFTFCGGNSILALNAEIGSQLNLSRPALAAVLQEQL